MTVRHQHEWHSVELMRGAYTMLEGTWYSRWFCSECSVITVIPADPFDTTPDTGYTEGNNETTEV